MSSMKIKKLHQDGFISVFIALVLMTITGFALTYTLRSSREETRSVSNEIRKKQALSAATAGLNHALGYLHNGGVYHGDYPTDGTQITADTLTSVLLYESDQQTSYYQPPSYYSVSFCSKTSAAVTCPQMHGAINGCIPLAEMEFTSPLIVACGWSDDDSASIMLTQVAEGSPSTPGKITTPVITKGTTNLLVGGASVFNYFNDLTVWAGGAIPAQSNTGKTFIRDVVTDPSPTRAIDEVRNIGNSPGCNNPPDGYACSTDGTKLGHDTIDLDIGLSRMSKEEFFDYYMGGTYDFYRLNVATWVVNTTGITIPEEDSTSIESLNGKGNSTIWVEGAATPVGSIGTKDSPVVLVVNGDLTLGSNLVINGLVFVTGEINATGTPRIYGSLLGSEDANTTGNMTVVFDPNILERARGLGQFANLQGSWKDW